MKKIIKRTSIISIIVFLLIALIYVSDITNLPSNIILFEGETLNLKTIFGVNIETEYISNPNIEKIENNKAITVAADVENAQNIDCTGNINLSVKVLGAKVKEINVNIIENTEVVPLGGVIGVKLYTNGVLVVGMSEISGKDSNKYKPYEGTGIEEGDVIIKINETEITCTNELTQEINKSKGNNLDVIYVRDGEKLSTTMKAVKSNDNTYKVGLWVRDAAAGVGTATFYEPQTKKFAALRTSE